MRTNELDSFIETWDREAENTLKLLRGLPGAQFSIDAKPPNIERPRTVEALAPGYDRIHREAVARIRKLTPADLDRSLPFFGGMRSVRSLLWDAILAHGIHHRGQLTLVCRLAGGGVPGLYGPNREDTAAMRAAASTS